MTLNQPEYSPMVRRLPGCLALVVAGVILAYLAIWALGGFLVESDALRQVDALVVLSGNNERIAQAAQLKKAGFASWVILTQAGDTSPDMVARKLDVPGEMLLIAPGQVTSTYEEALTVRQLMSQRGLKTCIVVTDPYHTQRARLIFREVLGQAGINVWVYPVQDHWYRSTTWWQSWDGIQVTIQEYLKLLAYLAGSRLD
jgi:uncharacterized SAM-binding protein YcdF (DUF218 family)